MVDKRYISKMSYECKCDNCGAKFDSEYNLSLILPRGMRVLCVKCTNLVVSTSTKEVAHTVLDMLFEKLGIK